MSRPLYVVIAFLLACTPKDPEKRDFDDDGFVEADDCNDEDPSVHPDASDAPYDGVDGNCDGLSDNDVDLDGFDSAEHGGDDCDDEDDAIHPDADERCDTVDRDCDGDPIQGAVDRPTWFVDADGDGHGTSTSTRLECTQPSGYASTQGDCNDADGAVHPGAAVVACDDIDNDCDGFGDEPPVVAIGAQTYSSLSAALTAAVDGNVVTLCEGVYSGAFVVADDVVIEGAGAALTTLQGTSENSVVRFTAATATLRGVTVRGGGGYMASLSINKLGGGVMVEATGAATVEDSVLVQNSADYGGGAWAVGSLTLVRSSVRDNHGNYGAGGIRVAPDGELSLVDTVVRDNSTGASGVQCPGIDAEESVIALDATSSVESHTGFGVCLEGVTFEGGIVRENAGGIYIALAGATVRDTDVLDNDGGRAAVEYFGSATLERVTIEGNTGSYAGAVSHTGLGPTNPTMALVDCTIGANSQDGADENAVFLPWGTLASTNTTWAPGSQIQVSGHGDYTKSGTLTFTCTTTSGCN